MSYLDFEEDDYGGDTRYDELSASTSNDGITYGDDFPVVSTTMQNSEDSSFGSVLQRLGSIGATAARVGTAVGTIQRDIQQAKGNYTAARVNAKTGNSIGTFWMYATSTEKAMIVLAVAAIAITVMRK